jgi:hypothetical protein
VAAMSEAVVVGSLTLLRTMQPLSASQRIISGLKGGATLAAMMAELFIGHEALTAVSERAGGELVYNGEGDGGDGSNGNYDDGNFGGEGGEGAEEDPASSQQLINES